MNSENNLFSNAIWILGNLASNFQFAKELFFKESLYYKVEEYFKNHILEKEIINKIIWLLCTISKGKLTSYEKEVFHIFFKL